MGWRQVAFGLLIIDATGGFSGLFVYDPSPGTGNLLFSVAATPGTDPFGNPYEGSATSYQLGGGLIAQLAGGALNLTDLQAAVPFTAEAQVLIVHTAGATAEPIMALNSAAADPAGTIVSMWLLGGPGSGTPEPQVVVFGNVSTNVPRKLAGFFMWSDLVFLSSVTSSPFALTDGAALSGSAGDLTVTSATDGNKYDTERHTETYENINITAVTGAGSTPISSAWPVAAGPLYLIRARFSYQEAAAGVPTINCASPALNAALSQSIGNWQQTGAGGTSFGRFGATINTAMSGPTMTGVRQNFVYEGYAIFTAAGTVTLQASTSAGADIWNVTGGTFEVFPVT